MAVPLALATRSYPQYFPNIVAAFGGDTLWAFTAFIGFAILFPAWSMGRVAVAALLLSYADEVSQLYHAIWIDRIRATWAGALLLGTGFRWSDLICYTAGVMLGVVFEVALCKILARKASD